MQSSRSAMLGLHGQAGIVRWVGIEAAIKPDAYKLYPRVNDHWDLYNSTKRGFGGVLVQYWGQVRVHIWSTPFCKSQSSCT